MAAPEEIARIDQRVAVTARRARDALDIDRPAAADMDRVRDIDDALAKANDTIYGLHGAVYTQDAERGYAVARRMRSGSVTVNGLIVDPKMPFGGFKQSGIGREGGIEGLDPYFELKTVYFA